VLAPLVTHFAGVMQSGPSTVSHAAPSAAGATQVPVGLPVARLQLEPALQPVTTPLIEPHVIPAPTSGCITHWFVIVLQTRPAAGSQFGPVACFASHAAPTVVPCGMQAPIAVAVAPTHDRP